MSGRVCGSTHNVHFDSSLSVHSALFLWIYGDTIHRTFCSVYPVSSFPIQPLCVLDWIFIIQVLNTVGWWVFELVMGRTPECRYLMGQKATLSWLWDWLMLAVAIDFSSKLSPCFLIGLWWNLCQTSQMCLFAWAQSDVSFQFFSNDVLHLPLWSFCVAL